MLNFDGYEKFRCFGSIYDGNYENIRMKSDNFRYFSRFEHPKYPRMIFLVSAGIGSIPKQGKRWQRGESRKKRRKWEEIDA